MGLVQDLIKQAVSPIATKGVSVPAIARSLVEHTGLDVIYLRFGDERREVPSNHPCYVGTTTYFTNNDCPRKPLVREATLELSPEYEGPETRFSNLHSADIDLDRGEPTLSYWLERLFYEAPNLKTLSLCIYMQQPLGHWRTETPVVLKLTEFHLEATSISAEDFLAMLASSEETLTSIRLKLVTLLGEWCSVLSLLAKRYPKLSSFRFGSLRENSDMGSSVSFLDAQSLVPEEYRQNLKLIKKGFAPYNWSSMVSYEGPDTAKVLDILSSCVKPKPEAPRAA